MATAKKLTDNHLTCGICIEVVTDPATFQCNHTFCKSCLLKYTKTQSEAIQARFIQCPSCRQLTKVANSDSPVAEWISQLKPSYVIQSLMDDFGGSPDVDVCSVCKEDGETTSGTMWCTTCEDVFCEGCIKLHKKMRLLRDHEVLDLRLHSNRKPKVRGPICRIHKDEKIKLFCKDCRVTMCTLCCSIKHRKCDDVETIDAMMPLVKEALVNEAMILAKKIQTYIHDMLLTNAKIEMLASSAQEMKDEVRKVCMAARDVLVRKENRLLDHIDDLTLTHIQELKTYTKSQNIDSDAELQRYVFIEKIVTSDCVADMFDMYESVCGASRGDDAREDQRPQTNNIYFEHDSEKLMRSLNEVKLGEVKVAGGLTDRTLSPVLLKSIDFSGVMFHDLRDFVVIAVTGVKMIIVLDFCSCRLCMYYVPNKTSLKNNFKLPSGPMGIAKVNGTDVAVTLPIAQQIAFIQLDPEPALQSTMKTKRKYDGLAFLNPAQLVAGTLDEPISVDIMDMRGNVLKSINTGVVSNPEYIHVTRNNNVVVSRGEVKSLVSVTSDGQAVFTFTPRGDRALGRPGGITSTSTGDILFVDSDSMFAYSGSKVIQLTESGQYVRDVLASQDGQWSPISICLDDDGLLYVTSGTHMQIFGFT